MKKIPIESTWAEFWNVWFMPPPAPRCCAGRLFITAGPVRRGERAHREAHQEQDRGEGRVGEVDREQLEQDEAERRDEHAAGREDARAVAVGEEARTSARRAGSRPSAAACEIPAQSGVEEKS